MEESLERNLEIRELVKVWRIEETKTGFIPVFAFLTYGWTFPLNWAYQGKIKSGVSNDPFDNGTVRMTQACSKKTPIAEQPRVIPELKQVWEIPIEIVGLDKSKANQIRNRFDYECNKVLSKFKVKDNTATLVGEEWYREISIDQIKKIRLDVWESIISEYGSKNIKQKLKKISPRGLQTKSIDAIIHEFKKGTERFKGIAPTGFGKTVVAFLTIAKLKQENLLKNRICVMTAPNQFLANKNANSFNNYSECNNVSNIINIPVFSGSDLGYHDDYIAALERRDKLAAIIQGYLQDNIDNTIILHTCNPSMELVDEVLDMISISEIDFAICDEAHTLASTYNNRWNYVLYDHRIKINARFFLTATEKNLINPDIIQYLPNRGNSEAMFNYMNNEDIFGKYVFRFSFAEGVAANHIVPIVAKIFEYSNNNSEVSQILSLIDSLDITELESIKDEFGQTFLFDKKFARDIISILSLAHKENRNKILVICSRNSNVDILYAALNALSDINKYLNNFSISRIKAYEYAPSDRQEILDNIHDSDDKHIVITGPWAITGVDCPSLDAIHWTFTPGTEISITQGTGRGTRISSNKENVMVSFNLDLNDYLSVIRSKVSSTLLKLHNSQFPSHDIELSQIIRRRLGRRFANIERDTEANIDNSIRISLDRIYEAAESIDLMDVIDSFRNRSTEEEIEILINEFKSTYVPSLLYNYEELMDEILQSDRFNNLINIKLTHHIVYKMFEELSNEYKILGRYSGYNDEVKKYIPDIIYTIAKKYCVELFGLKFVDKELILKNLQVEINKKIYYNPIERKNFKNMNITNLNKCIKCINSYPKINDIYIPVTGGRRRDSKDVIRPAIFNELYKNFNIKDIYDYDKMKSTLLLHLNLSKHKFILSHFGDRTTSQEWAKFCRNKLGDKEIAKLYTHKAMVTKRKLYGTNLENIKKAEWTEDRIKSVSNILIKANKTVLKNRSNNVKMICPDGHITSKNNYKLYCKNRGLDYTKCLILDKNNNKN